MSLVEQQQYRTLRALKTLLFLNPEEIVDKILEGQGESSVSASLIFLHLFSEAPPELASPHQVNRISNIKFSSLIIIWCEVNNFMLIVERWMVYQSIISMDGHPSERKRQISAVQWTIGTLSVDNQTTKPPVIPPYISADDETS